MKYLFFDIDGTLTDKKTGIVPDSTKRAIQMLQNNGHFVCIATGRAQYKTIKIREELGIHHLVTNGGAGLIINDELIKCEPLDREKAIAICKEADRLGYGILIAFDDSQKVIMKNSKFIEQVGPRQEPTEYILDENLDFEQLEHYYKLYISISKEEEDHLTLKDTLGNMRFHPNYLMYQYDQKDLGIKEMLRRVGGCDEDTFVFGDDTNDFVMFKDEWTKVCMGNGSDALKAKAVFITHDSHEDGIEFACRHFGLIE